MRPLGPPEHLVIGRRQSGVGGEVASHQLLKPSPPHHRRRLAAELLDHILDRPDRRHQRFPSAPTGPQRIDLTPATGPGPNHPSPHPAVPEQPPGTSREHYWGTILSVTFTHSAGRHGVSEQDAIWAIEHALLAKPSFQRSRLPDMPDPSLFVGPDTTGRIIE